MFCLWCFVCEYLQIHIACRPRWLPLHSQLVTSATVHALSSAVSQLMSPQLLLVERRSFVIVERRPQLFIVECRPPMFIVECRPQMLIVECPRPQLLI